MCREQGLSEQTVYRWRSRYAGMEEADVHRLRAPEEENRRLKRLVAELSEGRWTAVSRVNRRLSAGLRRANGPAGGREVFCSGVF